MAIQRLFIGGDLGKLWTPDPAQTTDDGTAIDVLALPNESAPAGPSGEAIFPLCYLVTRRFGDVSIDLTPIVDGTRLTTHTLALAGGTIPAAGLVEVSEIDLNEPYPSADAELIRVAPRGAAIQIELVMTGAVVEVSVGQTEFEVTRETKAAIA